MLLVASIVFALCLLQACKVGGEPSIWKLANTDPSKLPRNTTAKPCTIVLRDNIKGFLNWQQDWFVKAAALEGVTFLPSTSPASVEADVHIFHAPTHLTRLPALPSAPSASRLPLRALVSMEQPRYYPILADLDYLQRSMHLLVTYSLEKTYPHTALPNLPITYYPSHLLSPQAVLTPPDESLQTGFSTGVLVATFTSNCANAGAQGRTKYLEELMKYIQVHSYGRCLHNREEPSLPEDPGWPSIAQRRARKINILRRYKFYLAFENLAIEDYVSEKVFEGLVAGTLPVYRGSPSIVKLMPSPDSFIDANALSPQELARLLHELARDSNKYAQYMAFKRRPLSESFLRITNMSYVHPHVARRICDRAQQWQREQGW